MTPAELASGSTLECVGSVAGVLGVMMLAINASWSHWGWLVWCVSSCAICKLGYDRGLQGIAVQQLIYTGFNLWGVWSWIVAPALERRARDGCLARSAVQSNPGKGASQYQLQSVAAQADGRACGAVPSPQE